jgi:hypothetical protein
VAHDPAQAQVAAQERLSTVFAACEKKDPVG